MSRGGGRREKKRKGDRKLPCGRQREDEKLEKWDPDWVNDKG